MNTIDDLIVGLTNLVEDMEDGLASRSSLEIGESLVQASLADMSWLPQRYRQPEKDAACQYMLYSDPKNRFVITSAVFWPGFVVPVHDHGVWGLIGLYAGSEHEERYIRVDDRSDPNYAQLQTLDTQENQTGDVSLLLPPDDEIHNIRTTSSEPSCSLHIYGGNLTNVTRRRFDLETGRVHTFTAPTPREGQLA